MLLIKSRIAKLLLICLLIIPATLYYFYKSDVGSGIRGLHSPADCPGCNVVVIMIDTLRADHLPMYGYSRNTSPFLKTLFEKSTVFTRAYAPSAWTAPSVASVFTSVMPSTHGVITGFAATRNQKKRGLAIELNIIPENFQTLGEYMREAGYRTIGVADNLNIGKEMGFSRGFDYFKKYTYKGAPVINDTARQFLQNAGDDKPYFLYLHYMDPHAPYYKRRPWFQECFEESNKSGKDNTICAYNSEIAYVDSYIAELFEEYDWLNNSIVFVMSDHGEEFWDHGGTGHGKTLYNEMIHVPFAMYHPKRKPQTYTSNVHIFDLLPTLAGLLNTNHVNAWQGHNLYKYIQEDYADDMRVLLSERLRTPTSRRNWWKRAVIRGDWHFIRKENEQGILQDMLFNFIDDYKQLNNLVAQNMNIVKELESELREINLPNALGNSMSVELDEELFQQLRTLGYIN
mgnify:CR=1 FL=1